jgi:hypothetical protein
MFRDPFHRPAPHLQHRMPFRPRLDATGGWFLPFLGGGALGGVLGFGAGIPAGVAATAMLLQSQMTPAEWKYAVNWMKTHPVKKKISTPVVDATVKVDASGATFNGAYQSSRDQRMAQNIVQQIQSGNPTGRQVLRQLRQKGDPRSLRIAQYAESLLRGSGQGSEDRPQGLVHQILGHGFRRQHHGWPNHLMQPSPPPAY